MQKGFIDTHSHIYMEAFNNDRAAMVQRALQMDVNRIFLPNIDTGSIDALNEVCREFPKTCYPMMGLHPTSVKEDHREQLDVIGAELKKGNYIAVGEIGIDLYWDKTFRQEQEEAFAVQLNWAREMNLPVVIHARESFEEIFSVMDSEKAIDLNGVFHSFTGTVEQAEKALSYGFYIGINGIVTFKNSGLDKVVQTIPLNKLLLETDAPFLAPVPYRGKRNENSYVINVAEKIAGIFNIDLNQVAEITTANALKLFNKVV